MYMCMHFTTNRWTRRELLTRLLLPVGKPTVTNPTTIPSLQMRDSPRERTACWCCFSPRTLQYTISGQSRPSPSTCRHSRNFELKSQTWESFCCQEEQQHLLDLLDHRLRESFLLVSGRMEDEASNGEQRISVSSSSSPGPTSSRAVEAEGSISTDGAGTNDSQHQHLHRHYRQQQQMQSSIMSYRVNISVSDRASYEMGDDVWSCLMVLVTFWFFGAFLSHLSFIFPLSSCLKCYLHIFL